MRERLVSGRRTFSQLSRRWPASGDSTWKTTLLCGAGGLLRFPRYSGRGWAGLDSGRQFAPVEKLEPAPAAVKQAAFADQAFQQVEEPAMLRVDLVGLFETYYPVRATHRAAAGWTKVVLETARGELRAFALTAFINSHIAETFEECSMDPLELSTALHALHPTSVIPQFAEAPQAARQ